MRLDTIAKRWLLLLVILMTYLCSYAQRTYINPSTSSIQKLAQPFNYSARSAEETVHFPSFGDECALDLVTLGIENQWGRVSGMNGFGDREKAQTLRFEGDDVYRVVGAMVWFERPSIDGDGTIVVKVYEPRETDGRPERLLGQSDAIKVSEVVTSDSMALPTIFTFEQTAPVLVNTPEFILSCDFFNLYQTFDTLVLLQTISECGDGADSWELLADGVVWLNIASELSWQLNADWVMSAIVDFDDPTSTEAFIKRGDLQLYPPIPNPVSHRVSLQFKNGSYAPLDLIIYNQTGKIVKAFHHEVLTPGRHEQQIDISDWPSGSYYYRLSSGSSAVQSRFIKK